MAPALIILMLVVGWVARHPDGPSGAWADIVAVGDSVDTSVVVGQRAGPPPGLGEASQRLGAVPAQRAPGGEFAFLYTQEPVSGATMPVTWSPCRPIHYVINTAGAPEGFAEQVASALGEVTAATGLVFFADGSTDELPGTGREIYQLGVYGDRWAPVLIGFTDEESVKELAGRVAGLGGAARVDDPSTGTGHLVSGFVLLDATLLSLPPFAAEPAYVPILRHELGHMVGLGHVDDPTQLMNPEGTTVQGFQDGDLAGLRALGSGACAPGV